jgi:ABC-type bacteriocin/lantibiotic exporter with double-glycine peptidase domain
MGRTKAKTHHQPDCNSCGPASLKTALEILNTRKSLDKLIELCQTTRNGTPVARLVKAANKLGFSALYVRWADLRHVLRVLKHTPQKPLAAIVNYLYDLDYNQEPEEDSGHYATIATYSSRNSRITLFDSNSGKRKSYSWIDFQNRWYDFEYRRKKRGVSKTWFKITKNWHNRPLLILAKDPSHLPHFQIKSQKLYLAPAKISQ